MGGFQFKNFYISQANAALKVGTDSVVLGSCAQFNHHQTILDIGTGTGVLALMMAQKYDSKIIAIDIDEGAILDASYNVEHSTYKDKIQVRKIDFQTFAIQSQLSFDGIICNPPFFSNSLHCLDDSKTIARHTSNLTPKELFEGVCQLMKEDGQVYVIIPYSEKVLFNAAATKFGLYDVSELQVYPCKDSVDPNRVVIEYAKQWKTFCSKSLYIRNSDKSYTEEYKEFTKDFYVHLN